MTSRPTASANGSSSHIAVVGGSRYDTQLGCDLLRARGASCEGFPLALSSRQQGAMQAADPARLAATIQSVRLQAADGFSALLLFCNSAATTLVGTGLDEDVPIPILSPLIVFREFDKAWSKILLIGSRSRALSLIEEVIWANNAQAQIAGFADPLLIGEVENGMSVQDAFERSWLATLGRYSVRAGFDAVAVCCTHLTGVGKLIRSETTVPVIDVGEVLIELASTGQLSLSGRGARLDA